MKKYLALITILAAVLLVSSCSNVLPKPSQSTDSAKPSPSVSDGMDDTPNASSALSAAQEFLAAQPSAPEVGRYLTEHAASLTSTDGDLLLERLLLLQQDISSVMEFKILDDGYISALNDTMGGIIDLDKIGDIQNADVREAFQTVADALMTIVRYEETPVFEPDWGVLETLKEAFSSEAAFMVVMHSRLQGRYYFGDPYNFELLAADIDATDKKLMVSDGGFVRWQLRRTYFIQVSNMLYGPEGSFLGMLSYGDAAYIQSLQNAVDGYSGTKFGELCERLLTQRDQTLQTLSDMVSDALIFTPDYPLDAVTVKSTEGGTTFSIPMVTGDDETIAIEKINADIDNTARSMQTDGVADETVNAYMTVSGQYISITFSSLYTDENRVYQYSEKILVLDLATGERVTLEDITGKPFDSYKDILLSVLHGYKIPSEIIQPVTFSLTDGGMMLSQQSLSSDWPDYFTITFNGLRSFMDISLLF